MDANVVLIIEYRISMLFLLAFMLLFLRLRHSIPKSLAIAAACFTLTWALDAWVYVATGAVAVQIACSVIEGAMVQGTAFLLSKYRDFRALFTGLTSAAYVLFGNVAFSAVNLAAGSQAAMAAQIAVHTALLLYFSLRLRPSYLSEMDLPSKVWMPLCVLPLLFYCTVYSLYVLPGTPAVYSVISALFVLLLMAASYLLVFRLVSQQRRETDLMRNNEYLEMYAKNLQQSTRQQQEAQAETALIRHDMRHYAALANAYLDADEPGKIRELLDHLNDRLTEAKVDTYCANVAVNGILTDFARSAQAEHIPFFCEAVVPVVLEKIDEFEFATVVSNLLENAFNAVEQMPDTAERFVRMKARPVKGQYVLEVSNPFTGERPSEETGLPLSSQGKGTAWACAA